MCFVKRDCANRSDGSIFDNQPWEKYCKSSWAGQKIIFKEQTASTNQDAAQLSDELPHGAVIAADAQTAGRGRRGRTWVSRSGENIYFSMLLKPKFAPEHASMLTLVMALAVAQGIEAVYGCKTEIKWPNDILVHGKKVCGILTEMQAVPGAIHHVVIGVGINVNQMTFDEDGLTYATSLQRETGLCKGRTELLAAVLYHFEQLYPEFCKAESLQPIVESYHARLVNLGKEVCVLDPQGAFQGKAMGINHKGELMVRKSDGTQVTVYAGEVSVRGLYGYV